MTDGTYLSICAGAGLGSLGFDRSGWKGLAFVEHDPVRRSVLRYHHPKANLFEQNGGDLSRISGRQLPPTTAWIVTLPCRDFSIAGRRRGAEGPTGRLHVEFFRLVEEARGARVAPKIIVIEQAPGWLSNGQKWPESLGGDGLATVSRWAKDELARLGYPFVVGGPMNAWAFGVPQDRTRCFLVFAREREFLPAPIRPPLLGNPALLARTLVRSLPDKHIGSEVSPLERADIRARVAAFRAGLEKRTRLAVEIPAFAGESPAPPEWEGLVVFHATRNPSSVHAGYSQTITLDMRLLARLTGGEIVSLTPEAYEWLMGCDEGYTSVGTDPTGKLVRPGDKARSDMCGDGIVVPIMEAIGRAIIDRK